MRYLYTEKCNEFADKIVPKKCLLKKTNVTMLPPSRGEVKDEKRGTVPHTGPAMSNGPSPTTGSGTSQPDSPTGSTPTRDATALLAGGAANLHAPQSFHEKVSRTLHEPPAAVGRAAAADRPPPASPPGVAPAPQAPLPVRADDGLQNMLKR